MAFKRGASSARLSGALKGREDREYVLAAHRGQTLTLTLVSSPTGSVTAKLYDPANAALDLQRAGPNRWTESLDKDGDYGITVQAEGGGAKVTYNLTIAIR